MDNRLAKSFIHRIFLVLILMIPAKKSLGQNFLTNKGILEKIVHATELTKKDVVLEIGPGMGVLTEKLAESAGRVVAVEKDRRLIPILKSKFKILKNIELVEVDILKFDPIGYSLTPNGYKVIGNIPYYITSHFLKTIFEKWPTPELIVLMVQKEVAQRIVAKPPHMSILALSVQFFAEPKIISYVSRGSFRPVPRVDSAIIRLQPRYHRPQLESRGRSVVDPKQFFKLIRTAFAGKRKQLKNTLGGDILKKSGIRPESRPEELSLGDWIRIISTYN